MALAAPATGFAPAGRLEGGSPALRDFLMVKRLVLSLLLCAGAIVVAFGLFWSGALDRAPHQAPEGTPSTGSPAVPAPAPAGALPPLAGTVANFTPFDPLRPAPGTAFADADGKAVSLADFRGRVVLLNFWATWCVPCVLEMPALDRLQARLGAEGLEVVALSQDRDGVPAVVRFYEKYDFGNLGIYVDPKGTIANELEIGVLPTSLLIDREGRVVGELVGAAEWDAAEALALIRHYLGAGAAAGG
jgi:thiol-disulfide isomerase/thioredoxin